MRRVRVSGASAALMAVLTMAIVLFATGHLELRWKPAHQGGSAARDDHDHGDEKEGHADEERRVAGDKAILDAETIKAAGITTAPAEQGSVAEALQVTGEAAVVHRQVRREGGGDGGKEAFPDHGSSGMRWPKGATLSGMRAVSGPCPN